jgi:uncharacterized protein YpbB
MSQEALALLRSLAMRPHRVATNLQSLLEPLERDGFVSNTSHGWAATAKGCEVLEEDRSKRLASRNDR